MQHLHWGTGRDRRKAYNALHGFFESGGIAGIVYLHPVWWCAACRRLNRFVIDAYYLIAISSGTKRRNVETFRPETF